MNNPFPYSLDNKRYQTWNYYLKEKYKSKVYKVPLDGGFTCPNRDGKVSVGGCTFCSAAGSGDFTVSESDIVKQFTIAREMMERKWPNSKAIAYFQSYSNTYGPLEKIKSLVDPFLEMDDIVAISLATRPDCLEEETLAYLDECTRKKDIWVELGLQSIHDVTTEKINRGHDYQTFLEGLAKLKKTHCKICVHIINGLPYESKEMMVETAKAVGAMGVDAIKIHMLHLIEGTQMAKQYEEEHFPILTKEEYIDIVVDQLEVLPQQMIIQRLTGDGVLDTLIEPKWTIKKTIVLNDIDKEMVRRNTYQGAKF